MRCHAWKGKEQVKPGMFGPVNPSRFAIGDLVFKQDKMTMRVKCDARSEFKRELFATATRTVGVVSKVDKGPQAFVYLHPWPSEESLGKLWNYLLDHSDRKDKRYSDLLQIVDECFDKWAELRRKTASKPTLAQEVARRVDLARWPLLYQALAKNSRGHADVAPDDTSAPVIQEISAADWQESHEALERSESSLDRSVSQAPTPPPDTTDTDEEKEDERKEIPDAEHFEKGNGVLDSIRGKARASDVLKGVTESYLVYDMVFSKAAGEYERLWLSHEEASEEPAINEALIQYDVMYRYKHQRIRSYRHERQLRGLRIAAEQKWPKEMQSVGAVTAHNERMASGGYINSNDRRLDLNAAKQREIAKDGKCQYSSRHCMYTHYLALNATRDHIDEDPSFNDPDNLVPCCWNCHRVKTMAFEQRKDYILRPLMIKCRKPNATWIEPWDTSKYLFKDDRLSYMPTMNKQLTTAYQAAHEDMQLPSKLDYRLDIGEWRTSSGNFTVEHQPCTINKGLRFYQVYMTGDGDEAVHVVYWAKIKQHMVSDSALYRFRPWKVEYSDYDVRYLSTEQLLPHIAPILLQDTAAVQRDTYVMKRGDGSCDISQNFLGRDDVRRHDKKDTEDLPEQLAFPEQEEPPSWLPSYAGRVRDSDDSTVTIEYEDGTAATLTRDSYALQAQRARFLLLFTDERLVVPQQEFARLKW